MSGRTKYVGRHLPGGVVSVMVKWDGRQRLLYAGRNSVVGQTDLARLILADTIGVQSVAQEMCQSFRFDVVSKLDAGIFEITQAFVSQWLARRWEGASDGDVRRDLDVGSPAE